VYTNLEKYLYVASREYGSSVLPAKDLFVFCCSFPLGDNMEKAFLFCSDGFFEYEGFPFFRAGKWAYPSPFFEVFEASYSFCGMSRSKMFSELRRFCEFIDFSYDTLSDLTYSVYKERLYSLYLPEDWESFFVGPSSVASLHKKRDFLIELSRSMREKKMFD
jgi:hypothetical protein